MFTFFTDTDTDFTLDDCAEYGYKLISMPYTINDQVMYPCKTSEPFNYKSYYDELRKGTVPTTSSISKETYIEYFRPELEKGNDIFYIHFSRGMSGSFNNMDQAVAELKEEFKDREIITADTKGISALCYIIVKEAGDLLKAGKTPQEVAKWVEEEAPHFALFILADDLRYFARSGRTSNLAGTIGSLIGIRPIIKFSNEGKMEVVGKETGRPNAINRVVREIDAIQDNIKDHLVTIGHADCDELAHMIGDKLKELYGQDLEVKYILVNPTIGAHCGPNSLGIAFHAKHR